MNRNAMNRIVMTGALAGLVAVASPLAAQDNERRDDRVPPGHRPPPGMCRIWVDGVPAGQQPAPTDCATAVRNRPANGRVVFGDDYAKPGNAEKDGRDGRVRQQPLPTTLPEMIGAILMERGRRSDDVSRWLGAGTLRSRYVDRDRNGVPERVNWLNDAGEVLQVWIDANADGRADSVEVYEGGKKVRSVTPQQ